MSETLVGTNYTHHCTLAARSGQRMVRAMLAECRGNQVTKSAYHAPTSPASVITPEQSLTPWCQAVERPSLWARRTRRKALGFVHVSWRAAHYVATAPSVRTETARATGAFDKRKKGESACI